jgi:hypothetical protein
MIALSPWCSSAAAAVILAIAHDARDYEHHHLPEGSLAELDLQIQKTAVLAGELVGMFRQLHSDWRHATGLHGEIEKVTLWLHFLTKEREHITGATKRERKVNFKARVVCADCGQHSRSEPSAECRNISDRLPPWGNQISTLLTRVRTVWMEVLEQSCASSTLRAFPNCLARLSGVLVRLDRYVASLGAAETELVTDAGSDVCAMCGAEVDAGSGPGIDVSAENA